MMIPGRAVWMMPRIFGPTRSTSIPAMPAWKYFSLMAFFIRRSSWMSRAYSGPLANQRDVHGLLKPSRNPYGCVFCPTSAPLFVQIDMDMTRPLLDAVGPAPGRRPDPLGHGAAVDLDPRDAHGVVAAVRR